MANAEMKRAARARQRSTEAAKNAAESKPAELGVEAEKMPAAESEPTDLGVEAKKQLAAKGREIAKSLVDRAVMGNVPSARLLLELAAKQAGVKDEGVKRRLYSLAAELAAEPEWNGEIHAVAAETMGEMRAPGM